jgi:hypothetical protein
MLLNSPNARIWICASTGSNPESMYTAGSAILVGRESMYTAGSAILVGRESMYTAGSAILVGRESICFIIRFLNSSSCANYLTINQITDN